MYKLVIASAKSVAHRPSPLQSPLSLFPQASGSYITSQSSLLWHLSTSLGKNSSPPVPLCLPGHHTSPVRLTGCVRSISCTQATSATAPARAAARTSSCRRGAVICTLIAERGGWRRRGGWGGLDDGCSVWECRRLRGSVARRGR